MTSATDLAERLAAHECTCGGSCGQRTPEYVREASALLSRLAALGEPDADLVERLRKKARYGLGNGEAFTVLLREAADTIDRLNLKLAEAAGIIAEYERRERLNPLAGLSTTGINIWGDEGSIKKVQEALHKAAQIQIWTAEFDEREATLEAQLAEAMERLGECHAGYQTLEKELAEANAQIALDAESRTAMCLTIHEAWKALGVENHDGSDRRSLAEAIAEANAAREAAETEREAFRADIAERRANAFDLHTKLAAAEARLAAANAARDEAEEQEKYARSTLDALFDRRKLASAKIDEAVLDAAQSYLRVSRSGGMPAELSDGVEAVIADMVRLSIFADLFVRVNVDAGSRLATVEAALETCSAWLDRWGSHVGRCTGGAHCTCGLTAVSHEARAALNSTGET